MPLLLGYVPSAGKTDLSLLSSHGVDHLWLVGTVAQLNSAIGSTTFTPNANYHGMDANEITFELSEVGVGSGSYKMGVEVSSVNDPTVISVSGTSVITITRGTSVMVKSQRAITVTDVDIADELWGTLLVTISVSVGSLSSTALPGVHWEIGDTSTGRDGDADDRSPLYQTLKFYASVDPTNEVLASLAYHALHQPPVCGNGIDTLTISINDGHVVTTSATPINIVC